MPDKQFLEEWPLYRPFPVKNLPFEWDDLARVPIKMLCFDCNSEQTYLMKESYTGANGMFGNARIIDGQVVRIIYTCAGCGSHIRYFMIAITSNKQSFIKVGQCPPWDTKIDRELSKSLGDYAPYFRKALVCESQGYGIAAYAYYRRVVEGVIDTMLDDLSTLVAGDVLAEYQLALAKTKDATVAKDKIDLVKDLLPAILRPGGINPLATMHTALSQGLHGQSDEECMALAAECRCSLEFLVAQIVTQKRAATGFTESMRKLLDRKARPE